MAAVLSGCGTTRMTDTQRTATEQLLVSNAVDQSVSQLDFRSLCGKPVFFDAQYLDGAVDRGYIVSSIRQHLLASGCLLQEERAKADYVVEARSGGIGTNRNSLLIGVPQMNVPTFVPGQPSFIPEIPLAKKTDQEGVAKIAVFAFNRKTGQPLWQSGVVQCNSNAKDTWVLGAGPFQQGTIRNGTEFAGEPLPIPTFGPRDDSTQVVSTRVRVTDPAVWPESHVVALPPPQSNLVSVSGQTEATPVAGESALNRGTAWNLIRVEDTPQSIPSPPPIFTPPSLPSSIPVTNPGGQAETEPNKVTTSGTGTSSPVVVPPTETGPSLTNEPGSGGEGVANPGPTIDANNWYGALSRRSLR
jgi:hypothetical protein